MGDITILAVIGFSVMANVVAAAAILGGARTNFWTWLAWGILDLLALVSTCVSGGDITVIAAYTIGTFCVAIAVLFARNKNNYSFGRVEIFALSLGAICLFLSFVVSPLWALRCSVFALAAVSVPMLKTAWKGPQTEVDVLVAFCLSCASTASIKLAVDKSESLLFPWMACTVGVSWTAIAIWRWSHPRAG